MPMVVIIGAGFGGWVRSRGVTDGSVFGHGPDRTLYPQLAPVVMEAVEAVPRPRQCHHGQDRLAVRGGGAAVRYRARRDLGRRHRSAIVGRSCAVPSLPCPVRGRPGPSPSCSPTSKTPLVDGTRIPATWPMRCAFTTRLSGVRSNGTAGTCSAPAAMGSVPRSRLRPMPCAPRSNRSQNSETTAPSTSRCAWACTPARRSNVTGTTSAARSTEPHA